eukprot:NODE_276_length_12087_cov_0.626376.p5 type:complete len:274 gc:universal NODE_276_length_12087_cov_0.626376:7734-8555(+)
MEITSKVSNVIEIYGDVVVESMTYLEFNIKNKQMNVSLHGYDSFRLDNNFFVLTWTQNLDAVHFIVHPSYLLIVNGTHVFSHLQTKHITDASHAFQLGIDFLTQELQQICTGVEFEVLGIQDLLDLVTVSESQDLLLRIRNTQTTTHELKNSVRMKRSMINRINFPMYNVITELYLLDYKLKYHIANLDTQYNHYIALLNMMVSMSSHKVNLVIRKLVLITIGSIPLTVIATSLGMNLLGPGYSGSSFNFPLVLIVSSLIGLCTGYIADRFIL